MNDEFDTRASFTVKFTAFRVSGTETMPDEGNEQDGNKIPVLQLKRRVVSYRHADHCLHGSRRELDTYHSPKPDAWHNLHKLDANAGDSTGKDERACRQFRPHR